jgi:hypothetical protein
MNRGIVAVLAVGIVVGAEVPVGAQGKGKDAGLSKFGWLSSLEEGKAQARKSGKPLMVVLRCVP